MMEKRLLAIGDGCRLAWRFDGPVDAPVLLLSNSLGTTIEMWAPQIAVWARRFNVLRYDSRGHGDSDARRVRIRWIGWDATPSNCSTDWVWIACISAGFPWAGWWGWLAVHAPDRLDRLVLANTSAYMGPPSGWQARIDAVRMNGMEPIAEASLGRWFTPRFRTSAPAAVAPIRAMLLACDPAGYAGCCAAIRDMDQRPTVALNRTPTIVIAGTEDPSTTPADGAFLANSAEQGTLLTIPAAHLSNIECPDIFGNAVT